MSERAALPVLAKKFLWPSIPKLLQFLTSTMNLNRIQNMAVADGCPIQ